MKPKSNPKLHLKKVTIQRLNQLRAGSRETTTVGTLSQGATIYLCPTCDNCVTIHTCVTCNACPVDEFTAP